MNKLIALALMLMATSCLSAQTDKIKLTAGGFTFTATLERNATAEAFAARLPLTLMMNELNGNEKYATLAHSLPTAARNPGTIHAGDVMLYGPSTVVVFYKIFQTSYSYTRIGHIDDVANLQRALGTGNVQVRFAKDEATGIRNVKADAEDARWHTLSGVAVEHPQKGVYIKNGKKILK